MLRACWANRIAGLSVSFVKVNLAWQYSQVIKGKTQVVAVQTILDKIMPFMLPIALTYFVYWLITKKKWTIYKIVILLFVAGVLLSVFRHLEVKCSYQTAVT